MTSRAGKVDFTGVGWRSVEWTALCALYLRACESRVPDSILGDHFAAEAVQRIDYDFDRIRRSTDPSDQFLVALHAMKFDAWTTDFLNRHPDAVVLHLGCGLDSRAFRLMRPPGVQWFDIDLPKLIALRRKLYDDADGYRMIGMSVTDPGWLDEIPAEHPTLMVAEGLLPYLTEAENRQLFRRIIDRFSSGERAFDVLPQWAPRIVKLPAVVGDHHRAARELLKWGIRDGRQIEQWNSRLRYLESTSVMTGYARIPLTPQRLLFRTLYAVPVIRNFDRLYRFSFWAEPAAVGHRQADGAV